MTSEDDKPMHKQFLRVHREEEEDTWISGEELKTEGSSGSDEDVPRRKISPRKSRRRRSEGYTPPESRLSLPNLNDNKTGIAFQLSRPVDEQKDSKTERFSIGGELTKDETQKFNVEAAMARMRTRSSLDKTYELDECIGSENNWRPKRGSLKLPNLEEDEALLIHNPIENSSNNNETLDPTFYLPEISKKKNRTNFSDKIEELKHMKPYLNPEINYSNFKSKLDCQDRYGRTGDSLGENFLGISNMQNDLYYDFDEDRSLLKNLDYKTNSKTNSRLKLPNFDGPDADLSVQNFAEEMNEFYEEMSSKLKSLKNCPLLADSHLLSLDHENPTRGEEKQFDQLFKNLKNTSQFKSSLSIINKMDGNISEAMKELGEERARRLDIQRQVLKKIPKNHESQLFLQLCEFEIQSNDSQKNIDSDKTDNIRRKRKKAGKKREDKNFIEHNIEMAKLGMNFSLTDEQKQRVEKMLEDNEAPAAASSTNNNERLPSAVLRANMHSSSELNITKDEDISNIAANAYRLSDDHKNRLIEIDSALQAFSDDQDANRKGSNIALNLVKSLKDIDEKLNALTELHVQDEELLEKTRKKTSSSR